MVMYLIYFHWQCLYYKLMWHWLTVVIQQRPEASLVAFRDILDTFAITLDCIYIWISCISASLTQSWSTMCVKPRSKWCKDSQVNISILAQWWCYIFFSFFTFYRREEEEKEGGKHFWDIQLKRPINHPLVRTDSLEPTLPNATQIQIPT